MAMKMRLKIKNRSKRFDINRRVVCISAKAVTEILSRFLKNFEKKPAGM